MCSNIPSPPLLRISSSESTARTQDVRAGLDRRPHRTTISDSLASSGPLTSPATTTSCHLQLVTSLSSQIAASQLYSRREKKTLTAAKGSRARLARRAGPPATYLTHTHHFPFDQHTQHLSRQRRAPTPAWRNARPHSPFDATHNQRLRGPCRSTPASSPVSSQPRILEEKLAAQSQPQMPCVRARRDAHRSHHPHPSRNNHSTAVEIEHRAAATIAPSKLFRNKARPIAKPKGTQA